MSASLCLENQGGDLERNKCPECPKEIIQIWCQWKQPPLLLAAERKDNLGTQGHHMEEQYMEGVELENSCWAAAFMNGNSTINTAIILLLRLLLLFNAPINIHNIIAAFNYTAIQQSSAFMSPLFSLLQCFVCTCTGACLDWITLLVPAVWPPVKVRQKEMRTW